MMVFNKISAFVWYKITEESLELLGLINSQQREGRKIQKPFGLVIL